MILRVLNKKRYADFNRYMLFDDNYKGFFVSSSKVEMQMKLDILGLKIWNVDSKLDETLKNGYAVYYKSFNLV